MAQKKYRPGMNCEKTGKYTCYDKDGNEMYGDVDVEKGRRFPPFTGRRMLLRRTVVSVRLCRTYTMV